MLVLKRLKGSFPRLESSLIWKDQFKNFKKLIFVKKNRPNDCRVGCKSPSNLLELIRIDAYLYKLEQFERAFERDEIVNL
jgi:phage tail sheath gpL-like